MRRRDEELERWVREYLETNVNESRWPYHSAWHTFAVVRDADLLGCDSGCSSGERRLLRVAALLHDTGYGVSPERHEEISSALAGRILPEFGFESEEIAVVRRLIEATRLPTAPADELEMLICDADLGMLGSPDFPTGTQRLRNELELSGKTFTEEEWWRMEMEFLNGVSYYSSAARSRFGAGLERNRLLVARHLREVTGK